MASTPERPNSAPDDPLGDQAAWAARYGPALRRFFRQRAHGAEADDLAQEVFVRLVARSTDDPVENIERFLFKIAHNVLIDHKRHQGVVGRTFADPQNVEDPADERSPERIVIGRQAVTRLIVDLRALPPRSRKAFILHRFEEMTYPAIARRMGVSVSAVEQLISRALEHLAIGAGADR